MRKQQNINVIVHWPEDQKSKDVIQDATNQLFVKIIENRLSRTNLSPTEKECVVRRVISGLGIKITSDIINYAFQLFVVIDRQIQLL